MHVLVILTIFIKFAIGDLKIESVVMKPIRIGDIGLNFDMTLSNVNSKATYSFKVGCEKCCVFLVGNETECSSKIVGGTFSDIIPGKSQVVTLFWPNIILFNRVGYCDVAVTATKSYSDKIRLSWRIDFNTTYTTHSKGHDKIFGYIPKTTNISKCESVDLNPLESCSPTNCEAKYLGKRNYYNPLKQLCEPVPECSGKEAIYDYIQNECITQSTILTESDLERLKSGEFDKYDWEPSVITSPFAVNYDYPQGGIERETDAVRKNRIMTEYTLYFTVANVFVVLLIFIMFYCIIAFLISTTMLKFRPKAMQKKKSKTEAEG